MTVFILALFSHLQLYTPFSLGGCYRIMFVFFPRQISFVRQCLMRRYSSPTTRDGSASSNDASRKPVSPRMQEKRTKITRRIREPSFSPNTALFLIDYSPVQGLILAIKDPKVAIFAIMNIAQSLGLSFVLFFPTSECVLLNDKYSNLADGFPIVGLQRPWGSAPPLLCSSPRTQCPSGLLWGVINFSSYSPPWIISAVICCLNALHAGSRFFITFLDIHIDYNFSCR